MTFQDILNTTKQAANISIGGISKIGNILGLVPSAGDPQEALYANKPSTPTNSYNPQNATQSGGLTVQPPLKDKSFLGGIQSILRPTSTPLPTATPTPTVQPTATPTPEYGKVTNIKFGPITTKTPPPRELPQGFQFDPKTVGVNIPSEYNFVQPTGVLADNIYKAFPNEATLAAIAAWAENASNPYDNNARGFNHPDYSQTTPGFGGTYDQGSFQINEKTFQDFLNRYPQQMKKIGATDPSSVFDPTIAPYIAKLIHDEQGWGAWKGWQNKGITGF